MAEPLPQRTWVPEHLTMSAQEQDDLMEMLADGWVITAVEANTRRFTLRWLGDVRAEREGKMDPSPKVVRTGPFEDAMRGLLAPLPDDYVPDPAMYNDLVKRAQAMVFAPSPRPKQRRVIHVKMAGSVDTSVGVLSGALNAHSDWDVIEMTPIRQISDSLSDPTAYVIVFERDLVEEEVPTDEQRKEAQT